MRLGDDVELVVGAQDHVLPLGERGQADIGDRGVEGRLVAVDFAFVGQHEVAAAYVETTVASGDGFLGDADEGQRGVCRGHRSVAKRAAVGGRAATHLGRAPRRGRARS